MAKTEIPNRPTHRVYAVRKTSGDKSQWTQIGAAWANQDGKGFNLKLYLVLTAVPTSSCAKPPAKEMRNEAPHASATRAASHLRATMSGPWPPCV